MTYYEIRLEQAKVAQERLRKKDRVYLIFEHGMLVVAKVQITKSFNGEKLDFESLKVTFTMPNSNSNTGNRRITRYFHFTDQSWDFQYD